MSTPKEATCIRTQARIQLAVNVSLVFEPDLALNICLSEQQITLYPHRDSNNDWRILNATDGALEWQDAPLEYIRPGMRIKLRHIATDKALHSHDHRPPVSEVDFQNEVSAYGIPGFSGDANDDWIVEIDKRGLQRQGIRQALANAENSF